MSASGWEQELPEALVLETVLASARELLVELAVALAGEFELD